MTIDNNKRHEIIEAYLKAQDELFEEIQSAELFFDKSKLDKVLILKKKFEEVIKEESRVGKGEFHP